MSMMVSGIELHSPMTPDFYTFPNWLPYTVTPPWTPGSDSSFVNETIFTPWVAQGGYWNYASTYALNGSEPTWNGSRWTQGPDLIDQTTAPYKQEDYPQYRVDLYGETQDFGEGEEATSLYSWVNNEVVGDDGILFGDWVSITWSRTKQHRTTPNLLARRFTEELQASAFHTLDGWCEREYFSSLSALEPWHNLATTELLTLPFDREVKTRRVTGKTNLWEVADAILDTSKHGWDAYYMAKVHNYSYYHHPISTWWSSQAFDKIYNYQVGYGVVPEPTAGWMRVYDHVSKRDNVGEVYAHFEYKCPVLNGLQSEQPFVNNYRQFGFLFGDLLFNDSFNSYNGRVWQDTSEYPMPDEYQKQSRFKHTFGFEHICEQDFPNPVVSNITLKTLRTELYSQAAVNQAEYELNRSYCPIVYEGEHATNFNYRKVMSWEFKRKTSDVYSFEASYSPLYKLYEDYITDSSDWEETTNYFTTVGSPGGLNGGFNHIQLSKTLPGVRASISITAGSQEVNFSHLLNEVNTIHVDPNLSPLNVGVRQYQTAGGGWEVVFGVSGADYRWQPAVQQTFISAFQTNAEIRLSVLADNEYDMTMWDMKYDDFRNLDRFPCAQGEGRMKSCRDIWMNQRTVAEINNQRNWPFYDLDYPDIDIKCDVQNRGQWITDTWSMWSQNQNGLWQKIADREGYQHASPMTWINFNKGDLEDVLDSFTLNEGDYPISFSTSSKLPVFIYDYDQQKWVCLESINVAIPLIFDPTYEYDTSQHQMVRHPFIEGIIDSTCITVVDWNWTSVIKQ